MKLSKNQLLIFLQRVDKSFPTPLSEKTDLDAFADKLLEKATLVYETDEDKLVCLIAGYTENVKDGLGYASVLATLDGYRGRGLAKKCLIRFLDLAREKGLLAVHLYTARENEKAIALYRSYGFVPYVLENEPRPDDVHLIIYFKEQK